MTVVPPDGAVPLLQFDPTVQSVLVVPVHCWAAADRGNSADNAATEALISNTRWNAVRLPAEDGRIRCRVMPSV
ncbi:hypothetical protein [Bradyrhizobium cenepequi]